MWLLLAGFGLMSSCSLGLLADLGPMSFCSVLPASDDNTQCQIFTSPLPFPLKGQFTSGIRQFVQARNHSRNLYVQRQLSMTLFLNVRLSVQTRQTITKCIPMYSLSIVAGSCFAWSVFENALWQCCKEKWLNTKPE